MNDGISRRDFLNGMALLIGATAVAGCGSSGEERERPGRAVRGSLTPLLVGDDASLKHAHALRDGQRFSIASLPVDETVDLVVIGSGISGLAAAYQYRKRHPAARILILENHDDFGGHARRCEMTVGGRLLLSYGGSESIQSPTLRWSSAALALLEELGVDLKRFESAFHGDLYPALGMSRGVFFGREHFGVDKLVTGDPTRMVADDISPASLHARPFSQFIGEFPIPASSREKLLALYTESRDVLPGKTREQKQALLAATSYRDFIVKYWGLDPLAADTFQKRSCDFFALGIDGVPAADAALVGYPGFTGLLLPPDELAQRELSEPYRYHFPDGNASIARLLVRRLIPAVAPGSGMDDVVTARFDHGKLDVAGAQVRLRLRSTVVKLANTLEGVELGYLRGQELRRIKARAAIHAGYNMMLPYMMDELDEPQREALRANVKAPLAYAKVALRNWRAWAQLGVHEVTNPMGFFSRIKLDYPVSLGGYAFAKTPEEPIVVHMVYAPTPAGTGLDQRGAFRVGRGILSSLSYAQFEAKVCDELTRILGPAGFQAKRDIAAISIYRWGHGYAYGFNSLYDKPADPSLALTAKRPVKRVAIANSDAAWSAYAHSAIDEAARAVDELAGG